MKLRSSQQQKQKGSVLALVVILIVLLTLTGFALLKTAEGKMIQAVRVKSQESASSAAEAGYEKALFWMSQQADILTVLGSTESSGSLSFAQSSADYNISLSSFVGSRAIFKILANGYCGIHQKTIEAYVAQSIPGWEMGQCRVPFNGVQSSEVYFTDGEIINMPLHINNLNDSPDRRDIYISGRPIFLGHVSMGESRCTSGGIDKYETVMSSFTAGISFDQPASRILDFPTVASRMEYFRSITNPTYCFTPANITLPKSANGRTGFYKAQVTDHAAVHLKFYIHNNGQGYVRIYNNCTVAGYTRDGATPTWDYKLDPADSTRFIRYPIYGCHYTSGTYTDVRIDDPSDPIYVQQNFGGNQSEPGALIYVNGNVIIGCASEDSVPMSILNTVKGRIAVVATGNIWLTNELKVYGARDADGMPATDNTNVIGLISQGVVKIVDSGMTTNGLLYDIFQYNAAAVPNYAPIAVREGGVVYDRQTPRNMVVEASIAVGGGGWGAENVVSAINYLPRENFIPFRYDNLILKGSITEAFRGIEGYESFGIQNGYLRQYYFDERLLSGILPFNMGLKGKYVLVPGGWSETATMTSQ